MSDQKKPAAKQDAKKPNKLTELAAKAKGKWTSSTKKQKGIFVGGSGLAVGVIGTIIYKVFFGKKK